MSLSRNPLNLREQLLFFIFLLNVSWAIKNILVLFKLIYNLWLVILTLINVFGRGLTILLLNDIFMFTQFFNISFTFFNNNWRVAHFCETFCFFIIQNIFPFWFILKFIFIFLLIFSFKFFVYIEIFIYRSFNLLFNFLSAIFLVLRALHLFNNFFSFLYNI